MFLYEKVANNCYCKKWPPSANWVTWVICDKIWCFLQVHTKWQIYQYGAKTTYKEFAGVKEYDLFHLKEDHLAIKAKKKKIKPHTNRTKRCFFRSLTSLVAYGQLRAWMVRKKVSSDFFLWFNLWNKGQKERENKKCNYPRYWPKVKAGIERMSIGVRKAIGLEVWRLGWTNHVWGLCGVLIHIGKYLFEEKLWRFSVFVDIGGYQHRREILLFEYKYFHKSFTDIIYGLL